MKKLAIMIALAGVLSFAAPSVQADWPGGTRSMSLEAFVDWMADESTFPSHMRLDGAVLSFLGWTKTLNKKLNTPGADNSAIISYESTT